MNLLERNSKSQKTAWNLLRESLESLRTISGFSSLSSAVESLLGCLDQLVVQMEDCPESEDLATKITTLSQSLVQCLAESSPALESGSAVGITMIIESQIKNIEEILDRAAEGRLLGVDSDKEELMSQHRRLQQLVQQLLANMITSTWSATNEHLANTRLDGLHPAKKAAFDSSLSTEINRRGCTEGTRIGVLAGLDDWLQDPESPSIYWMNGMAGTGKTTISSTFCERIQQRRLLAASFFCTRSSAECRNVSRIVPTIAYQIARYSMPYQAALCEVLEKDPDARSQGLSKQIEELLKKPLQQVKDTLPDPLLVVIDALDECDDRNGVELMLDALFRYASPTPLKFLMTSRPEPEIFARMSLYSRSRQVLHLHDLESSLVRADIELYLTRELAFLSPDQVDVQELAHRSGILFIYAATLVRYIHPGKKSVDPHKRLRSLLNMDPSATKQHAHIDALYRAVLNSTLSVDNMETEMVENAKAVLRTVLAAQEPIGIEIITRLCQIEDSHHVELALQLLGSVLHRSEVTGLVSTLHASFPDFMFSRERSGPYFCDVSEHSRLLALGCFAVMEEQLRFNICDLESSLIPDHRVDDMRERIDRMISPTLAYACRYWGSHLLLAMRSDNMVTAVNDFFNHRLLFWMEVLSVKREFVTGIETLLKAKQWLDQSRPSSSDLLALIEDARNFVTAFASSPAAQSTPHIYISSLPFCPRSSTVYKNYWKRTRGLLDLKGSLMERREVAALATWNIGSEVYSVAYSPDGTRVAVGCEDGTVRILNAHDGAALLNPLQGHTKSVLSVAFSPDGELVASGSWDHTIQVWNAYNGTLIAGPLGAHTSIVFSIAFSFDGLRIVCGSGDHTIRIRRTHDGTILLGPLRGHTDRVRTVAFSPDGTLIASGSMDMTVRVWNSLDGTPAGSPFEGHTSHVLSVTFTPDGTRLVSGSYDKTIRVWNVSDGSLVGSPFEGHTDWISSVAISPDGTRVASGSGDRTVRVWNIDDGTLVSGPFVGHTNCIYWVAYSPDATRIVSCSLDGTIRIWNDREGLLLPPTPFHDHLSNLKSILLSSNRPRILSGSNDEGVWVWDISPHGITPSPLKGRSPPLAISSRFPLTASRIALSAENHGIQVLDIESDSLITRPLLGHTGSLVSFTFSSDVNQLVTGSQDSTVRVWDLQTSQPIGGPLRGHSGAVTSVALSLDCLRIVSCSEDDHTVRVWSTPNPTLRAAPPSESDQSPFSNSTNTTIQDGLNIQDDGWVTNSSLQPIFWVPEDLARNDVWPFPHVEFIITKNGVLHVQQQELLLGDQWSRCYIPG